MIKRKLKKCKECKKDHYIFGHGLCSKCYNVAQSKKKPERYESPHAEAFKPINKRSKNQVERNESYLRLRAKYMMFHPVCECCKVTKATEIHHRAGRDGQNLFKHFLAVCAECHRRIEMQPEWAKEWGYSITRLGSKTEEEDES